MFNAIIGVGGSGQVNHRVADDANTALYSTFAACSFFAGSSINVLGINVAVSLGALGCSVYMAAFLCYSYTQNSGFTVFAGALLGFSAALLWTAEGTMLMSYPSEKSKGKYISGLRMIFNLEAVIGSLVRDGPFMHNQYRLLIRTDTSWSKHPCSRKQNGHKRYLYRLLGPHNTWYYPSMGFGGCKTCGSGG